ncbi:hypothetical protein DKX38_030103 (mitochondrion) [Salix brachista]|uniref:Large ribosomal subunit protein uL16m n=1 Tax=Salix brachista TaxID=2182728 RepID=A0A5N5IVF9_9ROSI|nr:hypothetical protein DKX38_030103 [Salix brachista]
MPYPTSFMPDLNAIDYLLHARGLLCSWLGELSSLQTKNIVSEKWLRNISEPMRDLRAFPLRGSGEESAWGVDRKKDFESLAPEPGFEVLLHLLSAKKRCSRGCKPDGTQLGFGRYGTKSCKAGRLSYRAIEAARRAIIGQFRRNGKIWVRVLADLPITGKPTEIRMGRGKGNPTGWIARVSTGQILFEMDGVSLSNARQAATLAAHKPCSSTKFVQWS